MFSCPAFAANRTLTSLSVTPAQAHAHQQSDICASCVATTYHHPSMINMPVSAADRDFGGGMLYCDSCPRGFHFLCLDPPIDALSGKEDIPTGGWFCQECSAEYDYLVSRSFVLTLLRLAEPSGSFGGMAGRSNILFTFCRKLVVAFLHRYNLEPSYSVPYCRIWKSRILPSFSCLRSSEPTIKMVQPVLLSK